METKNVLSGIVSLAVVVICVATIMMPVLNDAMETAGDKVTYSNFTEGTSSIFYDATAEDISVLVTTEDDSTTITLNGEEVEYIANYAPLLIGDTFLLYFTSATILHSYLIDSDGVYRTVDVTSVTYSDGDLTFVTSTDSYTSTTTSIYVYAGESSSEELATYVHTNTPASVYTTSDLISSGEMGGFYFRASLTYDSTSYMFLGFVMNGVMNYTITNTTTSTASEDFTVNFSVEGLDLVDGTTDIYTGGTPTFVITNENDDSFSKTVTATRCIVLSEVEGHESSGAAYSLYAAIPIIVIAGIVVASISMIGIRRD